LDNKSQEISDLYGAVKDCTKCPLYKLAKNPVPGAGNTNTQIMFIGEGPGEKEDELGEPFVGRAGQLLDEMLASIDLKREDVYIANVVKHRPPGNRDPKPEEVAACWPYLERQIEIIKPLIICTLGKYSTQLLLNTQEGITSLRGRIFKINSKYLLPINHPAAALYTPSRFEILKADFIRLAKVIKMIESGTEDSSIIIEEIYGYAKSDNLASGKNVGSGAQKEIESNKNESSKSKQMGLF